MDFNKLVMITGGIILNYTDNILGKIVTDTRQLCKEDIFIPLIGTYDGCLYLEDAVRKGASIIFVTNNDIKSYLDINPNIGIIKIDSGLEVLKKLAIYYRNMFNGKVIAITGSNGKTTTKEMLYEVLKTKYKVFKSYKNYNNIIGMCKMILELNNEDVAIFELGMNHLGEIDEMVQILKPNIGVITNIGSSHIGFLGSYENILKAKMEITNNNLDVLFINNDDKYLKDIKYNNIIKYSVNDIEYLDNDYLTIYIDDEVIKTNIYGTYNLSNIACILSISKYLNLSINNIKEGLEKFNNVRMKKLIINNTLIIDDSYNANIESMKAGISYINSLNYKNKVLVLGDMLELGSYSNEYHKDIGIFIRSTSINKVYTYGDYSKYIGYACQKISSHYTDKNILSTDLKEELDKDTVIYFKASRRMKLEEVINMLK